MKEKIQELINESAAMFKEKLEAIVKEKAEVKVKAGRFIPEEGDDYYLENGDLLTHTGTPFDELRVRRRQCSRTKEEAQLEYKRNQAYWDMLDVIEEVNAKYHWIAEPLNPEQLKQKIFITEDLCLGLRLHECIPLREKYEVFTSGVFTEILHDPRLGKRKLQFIFGLADTLEED